MPTIVGEQRQVMLKRRCRNEEVNITDEHARAAKPTAFPAKNFTCRFVDTEYRHPA
jgi:hypothetical protein